MEERGRAYRCAERYRAGGFIMTCLDALTDFSRDGRQIVFYFTCLGLRNVHICGHFSGCIGKGVDDAPLIQKLIGPAPAHIELGTAAVSRAVICATFCTLSPAASAIAPIPGLDPEAASRCAALPGMLFHSIRAEKGSHQRAKWGNKWGCKRGSSKRRSKSMR